MRSERRASRRIGLGGQRDTRTQPEALSNSDDRLSMRCCLTFSTQKRGTSRTKGELIVSASRQHVYCLYSIDNLGIPTLLVLTRRSEASSPRSIGPVLTRTLSDQTPIAQRMISSRYLSLVFIVALSEHVKTAGQGRLSSAQVDYLEISQNIKSHTTRKAQKAHVPWNKSLAVLGRSLAFLSSLFPLPIFSVVKNESCTSCSMCSFCSVRLVTRVDCSSEISIRERSAVLYTQLVFCF